MDILVPEVVLQRARVACHPRAARHDGQSAMRGLTGGDGSDLLDAKSLGPAHQELFELRLGAADNLVLQHLYQPVN
jgi:hypothetical protein